MSKSHKKNIKVTDEKVELDVNELPQKPSEIITDVVKKSKKIVDPEPKLEPEPEIETEVISKAEVVVSDPGSSDKEHEVVKDKKIKKVKEPKEKKIMEPNEKKVKAPKEKKIKEPKEKRAPSPYNLFLAERMLAYKTLYPEMTNGREKMKKIAEEWKEQKEKDN